MTFEEFLARYLAARKMSLTNDPMRLPDDLWRQSLADAEFICDVIASFDLYRVVNQFHEEEEEDEK